MNRLIYLIYLLLLCNRAFPQTADTLAVISLKPAEFREDMAIVNNPVLVDVREFFEYRRSRIPGAINIPSSGNIDDAADTIAKTTHLFLYCTTDSRSRKVGERLIRQGFIHVYSLDGGISGWRKEGFPVERKKVRRKK